LIPYLIGHPVTGISNPLVHGPERDVRIARTEQTWAERLRDSGSIRSTGSSQEPVGSAISKLAGAERKSDVQDQYSFETDSQA
jgi:hypothetical protein